jgi:hypothetical protein
MLLPKIGINHEKKMKYVYRNSIKAFKRTIKQSIKNGDKHCSLYLSGLYSNKEKEEIYNYLIPILRKYYKEDIEFELNKDYFGSYRIEAIISN